MSDNINALLSQRLEAMESRIAHQEHWLDQLDAALAAQERRLTQLERLSALMQERLREQYRAPQDASGEAPRPQDEVPPHY